MGLLTAIFFGRCRKGARSAAGAERVALSFLWAFDWRRWKLLSFGEERAVCIPATKLVRSVLVLVFVKSLDLFREEYRLRNPPNVISSNKVESSLCNSSMGEAWCLRSSPME